MYILNESSRSPLSDFFIYKALASVLREIGRGRISEKSAEIMKNGVLPDRGQKSKFFKIAIYLLN